LGIRYLWIDALCIIQGDESDWRREAAQMASIYRNAYLTIAATASSDRDGGCYRTVPPERRGVKFKHKTRGGNSITVLVREAPPHLDVFRGSYVKEFLREKSGAYYKEFPLLERSWVYQERLLSSRMLHFCNDELIFECKEDMDCQCRGCRAPAETAIVKTTKIELQEILQAREMSEWSPKKSPFCIKLEWGEFVETYSHLAMSFDKDKLPAISAVARVMAEHGEDEYLAGMWRSTLLLSLRWNIKEYGQQLLERPAHPRAPTWSWASTKGKLDWPRSQIYCEGPDGSSPFCWGWTRITSVGCTLIDENDPFGGVSSGVLVLSGRMTPGRITGMGYSENAGRLWYKLDFDAPEERKSAVEPQEVTFLPDFPFDAGTPADPSKVFYVWIYSEGQGYTDRKWGGLVVHAVGSDYERIGIVTIRLRKEIKLEDIMAFLTLTINMV
jgi:hypothetical protein